MVIEDNVGGLLRCLLCAVSERVTILIADRRTEQSLLERLLVLDRLVCNLAGVVALGAVGRVGVRVVLGEDARAVVDGEHQDGLDAEERERARHGGGGVRVCLDCAGGGRA
mgnify:CR=1 FL=1